MAAVCRFFLVALLGALASGCGGGGGGGGGSSTNITLTPSSVQVSAMRGGALPESKSVTIGVDDPRAAYVLAGFPPNIELPSWLDLALPSGDTLVLSVTDTDLPLGTYSTTVRVGTTNAAQKLLGYKDLPVTYSVVDFGTEESALHFEYVEGAANLPAAQTLNILGNGQAWTATANMDWVQLTPASGTAPSAIAVTVAPASLVPGNHAATVTVTDNTSGMNTKVTVSLAITAADLNDIPNLSFTGTNGAAFAPQQVSLDLDNGDNMPWTAIKNAPWISLGANSGTTPATLAVSVNPAAANLASGHYTGTVTVSGQYNGRTITKSMAVSLQLNLPEFVISEASIVLGGDAGTSTAPASLNLSLNTGASAYPWTATQDSGAGLGWLHLNAVSGSVDNTPTALSVSADRSGLANGVYPGSILFSATVNGDIITESIPVTLNFVSNELVVSRDGFAFVDTPSLNEATASIDVTDLYGSSDTPWTAESDQNWLTVTPSGNTGSVLELTADASSLATDQVHYANVTVSSSETANAPVIKVGLWKGLTDPASPISSAVSYRFVMTDPVRPYAYLHNQGTAITVVNVYTGATVGTFSGVGTALGEMAISSDGSELYAVDRSTLEIVAVDPDDGAVLRRFPIGASTWMRLAFTRTDGKALLISGDGEAYDNSGAIHGSHPFSASAFAVSADGTQVCSAGGVCRSLAYNRLTETLEFSNPRTGYPGSNPADVALNADGSRVYVASGSPYTFTVLQGSDLAVIANLPGGPYPNNVEVGADGTLVAAAASAYGPKDLWFYSSEGSALGDIYLSGSANRIITGQVKISGDSLRAVVLTDDPAMKIISLP